MKSLPGHFYIVSTSSRDVRRNWQSLINLPDDSCNSDTDIYLDSVRLDNNFKSEAVNPGFADNIHTLVFRLSSQQRKPRVRLDL